MSVNYFLAECQFITKAKRFGLVDTEDQSPTTVSFDNDDRWNATVINNNSIEILFTAIDNCIEIWRESGEMESRCDAMLMYGVTLLFVELKNKRGSWQSEGLQQIEATMKRMIVENPALFNNFPRRKAVVANARHQFPCFHAANLEQREYFWKTYRTRVQFDAEIVVE